MMKLMSSRRVGCAIFHCAVRLNQHHTGLSLMFSPVKRLVLITLIVVPQPSILIVLVNHYLRTLHAPITFLIHLCISYTLAFLSFSSLIVCVARDPGPVSVDKPTGVEDSGPGRGRDDLGLREALMVPLDVDDDGDDLFSPVKWCRKCWAPKPERTHHCSLCGRCVLKMGECHHVVVVDSSRTLIVIAIGTDHHCPWLGSRCVVSMVVQCSRVMPSPLIFVCGNWFLQGHRTYPSFFHFIASITLLSTHVATFAGSAFWWSFNNPGLTLVSKITYFSSVFGWLTNCLVRMKLPPSMNSFYSPLAPYSVLSWVRLQYITCILSRTCQSTPISLYHLTHAIMYPARTKPLWRVFPHFCCLDISPLSLPPSACQILR